MIFRIETMLRYWSNLWSTWITNTLLCMLKRPDNWYSGFNVSFLEMVNMKFDEDGLNNIGDVKVPHTYRNHTDKCKKKWFSMSGVNRINYYQNNIHNKNSLFLHQNLDHPFLAYNLKKKRKKKTINNPNRNHMDHHNLGFFWIILSTNDQLVIQLDKFSTILQKHRKQIFFFCAYKNI